MRSLGADEVVDYRTTDVGAAVRDVDVVLDAVGGADQVEKSVRSLKPGGTVVTLLPFDAPKTAARAEEQGSRIAQMLVEHDHQGMRAVAALVARGALRPTIAETFPLAEAARAHEIGERGRTTGKMVLTVG